MIADTSILDTIKKLLGLPPEYSSFDTDIIVHINSVFTTLTDLGVGPPEGFQIQDPSTVWSDYTEDPILINMIKSYMYLKVRLLFDTSSMTSTTMQAYNNQIAEYEFRISNWKGVS